MSKHNEPSTDFETMIGDFAKRAPAVAEKFEQHVEAKHAARTAEAAILQRAVDAIKPALPALSGKVEARRVQKRVTSVGGRDRVDGNADVAFLEWKGLCLGHYGTVSVALRDPNSSRMYYVAEDGSFYDVVREPVTERLRRADDGWGDVRLTGYAQRARPCEAIDVVLALGLHTAMNALQHALSRQEERRAAATHEVSRGVQDLMNDMQTAAAKQSAEVYSSPEAYGYTRTGKPTKAGE